MYAKNEYPQRYIGGQIFYHPEDKKLERKTQRWYKLAKKITILHSNVIVGSGAFFMKLEPIFLSFLG